MATYLVAFLILFKQIIHIITHPSFVGWHDEVLSKGKKIENFGINKAYQTRQRESSLSDTELTKDIIQLVIVCNLARYLTKVLKTGAYIQRQEIPG